jgi:hypothetical protein
LDAVSVFGLLLVDGEPGANIKLLEDLERI